MKNRRKITKTPWVKGVPKKEDIGKTMFIKTFTDPRPYIAKIINVSADGSIIIRPADGSPDVMLKEENIDKYYALKTKECLDECKKA